MQSVFVRWFPLSVVLLSSATYASQSLAEDLPPQRSTALVAGATAISPTPLDTKPQETRSSLEESSGAKPETVGPEAGLDADGSDLGNAARITLNFRGYPDLSRDYRIAADSTLSVPVIGRIKVAGLTPSILEQQLASKMSAVTGNAAYVTAEIAEYRSVYVTGYVAKSEASSWQPGMTVLQAVAASGGLYRAAETASGMNSFPADIERSRIQRASTDLKVALASYARLQAEQQGSTKINMPERLVSLVGASEAEDMILAQTVLLKSRREAYDSQLAAIERGNSLARQELDGLKAQSARIAALLVTRRSYKDKVADLQARGIVVVARSMEEEIKVSDLEEKSVNVAVATARILGTIAGAERDAIKLRLDTKANTEADILKTEHDIAMSDIELESAKSMYTKLTGELAPSVNRKAMSVSYSIVRKNNGDVSTIAADPMSFLRPGDVLVVTAREGK